MFDVISIGFFYSAERREKKNFSQLHVDLVNRGLLDPGNNIIPIAYHTGLHMH